MLALTKPDVSTRFRHVVCGSGGPTAVLTGGGFFAGLQLCKVPLDCFETKGGASAGAINALMAAVGMTPAQQIAYLLAVNFSELFAAKAKGERRAAVRDWLLGELRGDETVRLGLRDSTRLGHAMELISPQWPKGYWTIGSCGEKFYVFNEEGVYEVEPGQPRHLIHDGPAPIATALRITTTIPLLMHPVVWKDRIMQDGCFTPYGRCPTGVVTDHFGGKTEHIVACVPEAPHRATDRLLIRFAQHLSGKHGELMEPQGTVVTPVVTDISSRVQFALPVQVKQSAILSGARATVQKLRDDGFIDAVTYAEAWAACYSFDSLSGAIGLTETVLAHAQSCEFAAHEVNHVVAPAATELGGMHAA